MRRLTLFLTVLFVSVFVLVACGGGNDGDNSSSKGDENSANADEKFVLKYNSAFTPSGSEEDPKYKATEEFARLVEERSDGRIEIEIFHSNQLAGQAESLDALAKGTFDFQNITLSNWGDKIPETDFTSLLFWNMNEEHSLYVLRDTEIGELMDEALGEYGVKLLGYWPASATGWYSKKPIHEVNDFKGLTVNVASSLTTDFYTQAGAGNAAVPFAEQYEALLRGTLDVIQFPFYALEDYKLAEVVEYIITPATVSPALGAVVVSQKTLDKLPEDLQQIVVDTMIEMEQAGIEGSKQLTQRAYDYAEDNDVEIIKLSKDAYEEFKQLGQETTYKIFSERNERSKRMVEILETETEKWIEENPEIYEEFLKEFE